MTKLAHVAAVLLLALPALSAAEATERLPDQPPEGLAFATFAGGCFWCMEPPYDKLDGVKATISGYTGGEVANPTYRQVSGGNTGHAEAVRIVYDPAKVSYERLLYVFWRNIDPLAEDRQFCDAGPQYRSAVFYHDEAQKQAARDTRDELAAQRFEQPIETQIVPAGAFYKAEDYHQNYYKTHTARYQFYRINCGRDARLEELWGDEAGPPHGRGGKE
ncbi:peptide-methionine (S)-S-oxide reductase MsrA [Ectothiorhodospiraceae bacterium WFHF3C12]|nr:peptide-methionine (S)-S-oxide reductase MsrA [Ectothiorhodospiraceae bacterium WFHF3C12]